MSELREECYKCLNNQSCHGSAHYGSIICITKRKFKMPRNNEKDSVYATKFAVMQQQINEKDKRIKELEEENKKKSIENICYQEELENSIPVQKVKDKIEELKKEYEIALEENSTKAFILKCKISALEELLEEK